MYNLWNVVCFNYWLYLVTEKFGKQAQKAWENATKCPGFFVADVTFSDNML